MQNRATLTLLMLLTLGLVCCAGAAESPAASGASSQAGPNLSIPYPTDVLTYHYNVFRQGVTLQETTLTPSNVNSSTFGKLAFYTVDGKVDAQPLFINKQFINGSLSDTLYVVTENDSIYAFSTTSGRQFWRVSALGSGETPSDDHGCSQISPQIGITDTPVIDKGRGPHGALSGHMDSDHYWHDVCLDARGRHRPIAANAAPHGQ